MSTHDGLHVVSMNPRSRRDSRIGLAVLALLSVGLVTTVNRAVASWLPRWLWLADACVPSLLVCAALYCAVRPARPLATPLPGTDWGRIRRIGTVWLAVWATASIVAAAAAGHWLRYRLSYGTAQDVGFLALGPLQEELLFRGAIYELAERSWPGASTRVPIVVSAALFGLHHLQLHGYHATPDALVQMGFAFVMGLVFGSLRAESGSLWPGLGLHVLTNLPGAFGS